MVKNKLSFVCSTFVSALNQLHSLLFAIIHSPHLVPIRPNLSVYSSHLYFIRSKKLKLKCLYGFMVDDCCRSYSYWKLEQFDHGMFLRWSCSHSDGSLRNDIQVFICSLWDRLWCKFLSWRCEHSHNLPKPLEKTFSTSLVLLALEVQLFLICLRVW